MKPNTYSQWTIEEENSLKELYGKISTKEIGIILNKTHKAIRCKVSSSGLSLNRKKFLRNSNYFSIPNLENCYWAGFTAADGNIKQSRSRLTFNLSNKDAKHLENLKNNLQYYGPLIHNKKNMVGLQLTDAQICSDLENNFNITPNKTFSLKPPNIDGELALAFIKGYIDGDGCIYKRKITDELMLSIISASKDIMLWIQEQLNNIYPNKVKLQSNNYYRLNYGTRTAIKILKRLDKISTPCLSRKWDKVKSNIKYCEA